MPNICPSNCIVPPHILRKLLTNKDAAIREIALNTLLATTNLRAERRLLAEIGFASSITGTRSRTIYDCKAGRILEQAARIRGEGDKEATDGTVNRAYDGLGTTYSFFETVFKRKSIDDRGMRLDGYVHYGNFYNNAFWNGRQMVFGDGDGRLFTDFSKSLDVIAHELTHGVTEFSAGLEYHDQSGALNESLSDVFGSLTKQWSLGQSAAQADWLIGGDILTPAVKADALRSLKAPGKAYDDPMIGSDPQPAHFRDYVSLPDTENDDWGGVHINSGIPNHAFYLVAMKIGGNAWDAAGRVWYETMRSCGPKTDFQEFADKSYSTAARLYGVGSSQQDAVGTAWSEVGIAVAPQRAAVQLRIGQQADLSGKIDKLTAAIAALTADVAELRKQKRRRA